MTNTFCVIYNISNHKISNRTYLKLNCIYPFTAPNVYNIPSVLGAPKEGNKRAAPAYTISGRQKEPLDERVKNPGPGAYKNVDPENYKTHSPAYSISARYNLPSDSTKIPGPGVYSPEKVCTVSHYI